MDRSKLRTAVLQRAVNTERYGRRTAIITSEVIVQPEKIDIGRQPVPPCSSMERTPSVGPRLRSLAAIRKHRQSHSIIFKLPISLCQVNSGEGTGGLPLGHRNDNPPIPFKLNTARGGGRCLQFGLRACWCSCRAHCRTSHRLRPALPGFREFFRTVRGMAALLPRRFPMP